MRLHPALLLAAATAPFTQAADQELAGGLKIDITKPVTCSRPTASGDQISVHYRGTLQSTGAEFDASYKRGVPITFLLGAGRVIKGWDQGLLDMCPGEKRKLTIPPALGYGDHSMGPKIPAGSTLVFETELMDIIGVKQEAVSTGVPVAESATSTSMEPTTMTTKAMEATGTAVTDRPPQSEEHKDSKPDASKDDPTKPRPPPAECHLLGPFALLVQGALGAVAILSLVFKRYRETPKRPWKIFTFDVSKQVLGSILTHILNLAMSMLGSVAIVNAAQSVAEDNAAIAAAAGDDEGKRMPNPCSFYLLNLGIDTTIGIPVLYLLLKLLHRAALYTPLARPPASIKSGSYSPPGQQPLFTWWLKQLLLYFIGLVGMKLFVVFLFSALPWLPWVGDWALRWTKGSEVLEVLFAMFIFPLAMNGVQYWIIDSFIMDKNREGGKAGYEAVGGERGEGEDEEAREAMLGRDGEDEHDEEDGYQGEQEGGSSGSSTAKGGRGSPAGKND